MHEWDRGMARKKGRETIHYFLDFFVRLVRTIIVLLFFFFRRVRTPSAGLPHGVFGCTRPIGE